MGNSNKIIILRSILQTSFANMNQFYKIIAFVCLIALAFTGSSSDDCAPLVSKAKEAKDEGCYKQDPRDLTKKCQDLFKEGEKMTTEFNKNHTKEEITQCAKRVDEAKK